MTAFLWAVLAYAALHVLMFVLAVISRDAAPRRLSLPLAGLGVWAAWLLVV